LPFLLEPFALSQRGYGKYVPALAPGGAARSTKALSKRAIARKGIYWLLAVACGFFSDPRCWGSMRNCKLNLCPGQQFSDFVLDLFRDIQKISVTYQISLLGQKVPANKVTVVGQRPNFLRGAG
jgi:hypothetical protein